MIGIVGTLISSAVTGISDWSKGRQELKKVKLEADKVVIQAEAEAKLAVSKAKVRMAENAQTQDYNLDKIAMENMEKSYKDEYLLGMFSIPMILAFVDPELVEKGFNAIAGVPSWYQYTFIGMVVVIYGLRGLASKLLDRGFKMPGK